MLPGAEEVKKAETRDGRSYILYTITTIQKAARATWPF
jgi:hypothetical protein